MSIAVEVFLSLLCLRASLFSLLQLCSFFSLTWFLFSFLWIPFPLVHLLVCELSALTECLEEWLSLCVLKESKCSQPAGGQVCLSVSMALSLLPEQMALLSLSSQESIQEKADFLPPLHAILFLETRCHVADLLSHFVAESDLEFVFLFLPPMCFMSHQT